MIIAVSIVAILMTTIIGLVVIVCVSLFSTAKYGNTSDLEDLRAEWQAFEAHNNKDDPKLKEMHDRIVTLENRAGVMIGPRR